MREYGRKRAFKVFSLSSVKTIDGVKEDTFYIETIKVPCMEQ